MSTELDARSFLRIRRLLTTTMTTTVLSVGAIAISGCDNASTKAASSGFDGSSTTTEQLQAGGDEPADDSLLAQAQQDVDFFLNQRDAEARSTTGETEADSAGLSTTHHDETQAEDAARPASIDWNDPIGAGAAPRGMETAALRRLNPVTKEDDTSQPPIINKTLYRDDPAPAKNVAGTTGDYQPDPLRVNRAQQLIVDLSGELYRNAQRSDTPLRELMLIAATSLVSPDRSINAHSIASLSERDRELLVQMQQFFASLGGQLGSAQDSDEVVRSAIVQLQQALDQKPPFGITTAALCTKVRGFGNYDEFNKHTFLAQKQQKIIVYLELDNFTSELNDRKEWVTELAQELVIYSGTDGIAVWSEAWQSVVDVTRNKRQDFFTVQMVTLPKALSVGRYHLKVRMRDEATGAMTERSIAFEMVADPRMAAQVR